MREGRFRPEVGDGQRLFERQGAGHDFAINRPQRFIGDRPLVLAANPLQHRPFAVRRVNLLAGLEFDLADGQHVLGPLVQELDDLRVELVDRLAMFRNVHNWGGFMPGCPQTGHCASRRSRLRCGRTPSAADARGWLSRADLPFVGQRQLLGRRGRQAGFGSD